MIYFTFVFLKVHTSLRYVSPRPDILNYQIAKPSPAVGVYMSYNILSRGDGNTQL